MRPRTPNWPGASARARASLSTLAADEHVRRLWWLSLRLAALGALVLLGDRASVFASHQGWTADLQLVIAVRLVTALLILRLPLEGFLVALELDKWDWYWLAAGSRSDEFQLLYQEWDKVLDLFALALAALVAAGWRDPVMRALALGSFALRVVGVAAFVATDQRWLLVAFPNVFENFYLMYVVFRVLSGRERMLTSAWVTTFVALAALLPRLVEEYFLHVLERRPWDWVDLPIPHTFEPRVWIVAAYAPSLLTMIVLALRPDPHAERPPAAVGAPPGPRIR